MADRYPHVCAHLIQKAMFIRPHLPELVASVVVFVLLCSPGAWRPPAVCPIRGYRAKLVILWIIGLSAAGLVVIGIWVIGFELRSFGSIVADDIPRFVALRHQAKFLLVIVGILLALAILGIGTLRNAILAHDPTKTFPVEYIVLYGAYLSALLALAYAPAHLTLLDTGERKELLQLKALSGESIKSGLAVLSPLAGGIVTFLFGKKTKKPVA